LFLLFGSSAAGKTSTLEALRPRFPELAMHDFDEIGVPPDADTAWRQRMNEVWVKRALEVQAGGGDFLLAGQTPFGELLATPSASRLHAVRGCLIDCDDETRLARLRARGQHWLARSSGDVEAHVGWAEWMRHHAVDPSWHPEVIRHTASDDAMQWSRWADWKRGDPRWRVRVVDTSALGVDRVAEEVATWIVEERLAAAL
jgi:hypothetical protein